MKINKITDVVSEYTPYTQCKNCIHWNNYYVCGSCKECVKKTTSSSKPYNCYFIKGGSYDWKCN